MQSYQSRDKPCSGFNAALRSYPDSPRKPGDLRSPLPRLVKKNFALLRTFMLKDRHNRSVAGDEPPVLVDVARLRPRHHRFLHMLGVEHDEVRRAAFPQA